MVIITDKVTEKTKQGYLKTDKQDEKQYAEDDIVWLEGLKTKEMDEISGLETTKNSKEADLTDATALVNEKQSEIDTVLGKV